MKLIISEMSEAQIKDYIVELKALHNQFQSKTYQLREKVDILQAELLRKKRERIMVANALKLQSFDTTELEKQTGLSQKELLKGLLLIHKEKIADQLPI